MSNPKNTPQLLVSVRHASEVAAALEGGADLIDVKEPSRGALGAAEADVVAAVVDAVAGRVPVSAALGEWSEHALVHAHWHLELPLRYVKWGLSGYPHTPGWGEDLLEARRQLPAHMDMVLVAYADWGRAKAIPPLEVARFARRYRFAAFLLDTCVKDGKCLLDFLKPEAIAGLIEPLQNAGITVALGGGLRPEHVKALRGLRPDYFAVRASACAGSKRTALIDPHRVRKWKETLAAAFSPARS